MDTKKCTHCREDKPLTDFHVFGRNRERIGRWCAVCYDKNAKQRAASKQRRSEQHM